MTWGDRRGGPALAKLLMLVGCLVAVGPVGGAAQEGPLRYQGLVFGYSDREDVERFLGERLECGRYHELEEAGHVRRASMCLPPEDSRSQPQALFVNGRLKSLRYMLAPGVAPDRALERLSDMYGRPEKRQGKREGVRGLRYWEFPADPYAVVLSEARNEKTGQVRLRVSLLDPRGDWMQR